MIFVSVEREVGEGFWVEIVEINGDGVKVVGRGLGKDADRSRRCLFVDRSGVECDELLVRGECNWLFVLGGLRWYSKVWVGCK